MSPSGEVAVGLGRSAVVGADGTLAVHGLGSCVAVVLHDSDAALGGIVHVVLPSRELSRDQSNPARFAESAVPHLVTEMEAAGGRADRLTARLVGGASMFAALTPAGTEHIGRRNSEACRAALDVVGVPIVGEAVGGEAGRSLRFEVGARRLVIWSVGDAPREL